MNGNSTSEISKTWLYLTRLSSSPPISENGIPVATGNSSEIQTGMFGRMESSPCLEKLSHKIDSFKEPSPGPML